MNCPEARQLLQDRLDGQPVGSAALAEHLAGCADCRNLHAGAEVLLEGLRRLKPAAPCAGLAERIADEVLADRDRRLAFRRRLATVTAVAAGLLLAVATLWFNQADEPAVVESPAPTPAIVAEAPQPPRVSLRGSVSEAGSAIVSLTWRTADDTVASSRLLIPEAVAAPLPVPDEVPELPAPDLWTSAGMSAGLEPITTSARRAFSMLLRENPVEQP